jgi:hypothetical protein
LRTPTPTLQPLVDEQLVTRADLLGLPVREHAEVAFVLERAVERVVSIERQTVLTGLQIFEAIGHLRLPDAKAKRLVWVDEDVRIPVAHDRDVVLIPDAGGEIGL